MKNKKLIATFLCISMLMALGGCDKSEAKKTEEAEESKTSETAPVETETKETPKETEKTEEPEDTEEPEGSGNETGNDNDLSMIYSDFREFATALNDINGDLLYGFGKNSADLYDMQWEYVLLVYSDNEVLAYRDNNGIVESVEQDYFGYNEEEWAPETFLFEYEDFMQFPFLEDFPNLADGEKMVDPKTIDAILPDGGYGGQLLGFSSDMKYFYGLIGPERTIDKTMEECIDLKAGDKVKLDGSEMEVASVEYSEDDNSQWKGYVITLGEIDYGGFLVFIGVDDNGDPNGMLILDSFANPTFSYYKLCKVPIAEDAEISVEVNIDGEYKDITTVKGSELSDYMSKWIDGCPALTKFEDGGVKVNGYTMVGFGIQDGWTGDPARIENGELVYFDLMLWG